MTNGYGKGYHKTKDFYALDFTLNACDSFDKPILTTAKGKVIKIRRESDWDSFGYGNTVVIQHDNGFSSRYAHLNKILVSKEGEEIPAGFIIGTAGNSGNVYGIVCPQHPGTHLHFVVYKNNEAYEPKSMSGYQEFKEGNPYKSDNEIAIQKGVQTIEGWKTLQDKKYSIKYPSNWKLYFPMFFVDAATQIADLIGGHLTLKNKETCKDFIDRMEKGGPEIKATETTIFFPNEAESLEKNIETINHREWSYIVQKSVMDPSEVYSVGDSEGGAVASITMYYYGYCTEQDGRMFIMNFYDNSYPSSKKELFNQVLSTFKFE